MNMKLVKVMTLMVLAALLLALSSACTGNTDPGSTNNTSQSDVDSTTEVVKPEEPAVLNLMNVRFRHTTEISPDNYSIHYIENKTNTKLNITSTPAEQAEEKLNIQIASGERPDIIQYGTDQTEFKLAEADLLLPLNNYSEKLPNLFASRDKLAWDAMTHKDGSIYAIPPVDVRSEFTRIYRQDWLDKFGLSVPQTIDEYYAVADAISNNDPDGNNQKDTYAFGARGSLSTYFDHIFSAYGCLPSYWMVKDGQLVNGSIDEGAKEALLFLKKMYDAGMIDPEFTTDNSSRLKEKVNKGRFGAFNYGCYILDTSNIYNNYQPFIDANPGAKLVSGPLLKGPSGASFGNRINVSLRGWVKTSVLKETKNLDACIRLIEYLASEEGTMFLNYGVKDEHYAVDAKGVVKNLMDGDKLKLLGINELMLVMNSLMLHTSQVFQDTLTDISEHAIPDPTDGMTIPEITKYTGDLKDMTNTAFFKMIIGDIPIEGGFENYVKEWKKSGGDELTAAVNAEYQKRK